MCARVHLIRLALSMWFFLLAQAVLCTGSRVLKISIDADHPERLGPVFGSGQIAGLRSFAIFCLVFYTSQVLSRSGKRFGDMWSTLGTMINFCGVAAGYLSQSDAIALTRYCYTFFAMHYLMIDLELCQKDWDLFLVSETLTADEVAFLLTQKAPNLTLFMWSIKVIKNAATTKAISHETEVMLLEALGKIRGVGAKQVLWQVTPIPGARPPHRVLLHRAKSSARLR